ncbi:MAG TPA: hypothetical protein EYJ00_04985 [Gammaproteobacteria bacterium]|nr:hypothetical protein [Gammaproteobacteria bacterium]
MKILTASFVLFSSIWLPALSDQYYPIEGWLSTPINLSFISIYLLAFLTLLASFKNTTKD